MGAMTPKYPEELHNKKFYCPLNKKEYCINLTGTGIKFCEDCFYGRGCSKESNGSRESE